MISGYTSSSGSPTGWATSKGEQGSVAVAIAGITDANGVYHIWQQTIQHRSPCFSQGASQQDYATPDGASIVVESNCTYRVVGKVGDGG